MPWITLPVNSAPFICQRCQLMSIISAKKCSGSGTSPEMRIHVQVRWVRTKVKDENSHEFHNLKQFNGPAAVTKCLEATNE